MIEQISLYTENRLGSAREVFTIFAENDINVLGIINSDSGEFGTMRMIVSDTAKAIAELHTRGYLCKVSPAIATELEDKPGALEKLLAHIENMNINIDYMYVGYMRESNMPVIIVHCDDMDIVEKSLSKYGYKTY